MTTPTSSCLRTLPLRATAHTSLGCTDNFQPAFERSTGRMSSAGRESAACTATRSYSRATKTMDSRDIQLCALHSAAPSHQSLVTPAEDPLTGGLQLE